MGKLLQLLLRNGGFVAFLVAEVVSFSLIVSFNETQKGIWANTTGIFGADLQEKRQLATDYFSLSKTNDSLYHVIDSLQARLANARMMQVPIRDTFFLVQFDSINRNDSIRRKTIRPQYEFVSAKVVNNDIASANNWILINRGTADGVHSDMAVVSAEGIVGVVRHAGEHFSIVMSVLHRETRISAALPQQKNAFGSLTWDAGDPEVLTLRYIPQHFGVKKDEPVVTSGYSLMFPQGHPVGKVLEDPKPDPENPYFLVIKVKPSQDMATVRNVAVVRNLFKPEIDSLLLKISSSNNAR